MLEKWLLNLNNNFSEFRWGYWWWAGLFFFALDLASYWGWQNLVLANLLALVLALVWLIIASRRLAWGLIWLVAELIIGSFGHLFNINWQGWILPWRYLIFIFGLGLLVLKIWQHRKHWQQYKKELIWWSLTLAILAGATLVGLILRNDWANIFLDMNGYAYLLLWPLFLLAKQEEPHLWDRAKEVLSAAVVWLGIKTCLMFFLFGHYPSYDLSLLYSWWRDTGLGEITRLSDRYYRIFSQSHLWSAAAVALGLVQLFKKTNKINKNWFKNGWLWFTWFNLVVVIISLSRSLWLALFVSWLGLMSYLWLKVKSLKKSIIYFIISLILVILAWSSVKLLANLSVWGQPVGLTVDISQRWNTEEAAGQSRLKLFKPLLTVVYNNFWLGRGFGATVTYQTSDPRIVGATAGGSGLTTTYAFEWGYLDLLYKLGLLGFVVYLLFFIRRLDYGIFKKGRPVDYYGLSLIAVWLVLLVVNLTTPYFNHPLGIGLAMWLMLFYQPNNRSIFYD